MTSLWGRTKSRSKAANSSELNNSKGTSPWGRLWMSDLFTSILFLAIIFPITWIALVLFLLFGSLGKRSSWSPIFLYTSSASLYSDGYNNPPKKIFPFTAALCLFFPFSSLSLSLSESICPLSCKSRKYTSSLTYTSLFPTTAWATALSADIVSIYVMNQIGRDSDSDARKWLRLIGAPKRRGADTDGVRPYKEIKYHSLACVSYLKSYHEIVQKPPKSYLVFEEVFARFEVRFEVR